MECALNVSAENRNNKSLVGLILWRNSASEGALVKEMTVSTSSKAKLGLVSITLNSPANLIKFPFISFDLLCGLLAHEN
jgi:hypothetical protein